VGTIESPHGESEGTPWEIQRNPIGEFACVNCLNHDLSILKFGFNISNCEVVQKEQGRRAPLETTHFNSLTIYYRKTRDASPPCKPPTNISFRGQRNTGQRRALSHTYFTYRRNALSKLAYRMQRSVLLVTRYASPVTAPCTPNAQTVEIAKWEDEEQFENMRCCAE
jgi:hypothetical protein